MTIYQYLSFFIYIFCVRKINDLLIIFVAETSLLRADTELSSWAAEMALEKEQGGAGIKVKLLFLIGMK